LSLIGKREASQEEAATESNTNTNKSSRAAAVNQRTVVAAAIRSQVNTEWGQSYFSSDKGKTELKFWVRMLFIVATLLLNAATLLLLCIIVLPTQLAEALLKPDKLYLIAEAILLAFLILMNELVHLELFSACPATKCFCCSQHFMKNYVGFLANDRARIGTFVLQGFVTICIGDIIAYIFGGLLVANALLQLAVWCGWYGKKATAATQATPQSPRANAPV
jgi:hypothetical protein